MRSPNPHVVRLVLVALIGSLISVTAVLPSFAQSQAQQLESTRAEIADIRKRLNEARGRASDIQREVDRLDRQVAELNRQIRSGEHDISSLESDIRSLQAQIDEAQAKYQQAADTANARARRLYVNGPAESIAMIFSADSISDMSRLQFLMEKSSERDSQVIVEASRLRAELLDKQNELNRIKGSLDAQRQWLQERKSLVDSARRERASALASVESEIASTQRHIDGLQADSRRLQAALQASTSQSSGGSTAASSQGFVRPVPGRVTSGYGRRWGRAHTGVDLAGRTGDPIRAAKAGTIVGVACGSGYGTCTIIDHGGGVTTLYAHLSRKAVSSGRVQQGQVIGYVGCTGSCTGPHLHFEVRVNGSPRNPMAYL